MNYEKEFIRKTAADMKMPKKISDRIPWAKERSEEHNAQIKKNKAKYRGMEL